MNCEKFQHEIQHKFLGKPIDYTVGALEWMLASLKTYDQEYTHNQKKKKLESQEISRNTLKIKNKEFLENCDYIIPGMLVKVQTNASTNLRLITECTSCSFTGRHVVLNRKYDRVSDKTILEISYRNYITDHLKDKVLGFYCDINDIPTPDLTDFSNYRTTTFIRENIGPHYDF